MRNKKSWFAGGVFMFDARELLFPIKVDQATVVSGNVINGEVGNLPDRLVASSKQLDDKLPAQLSKL